MKRQRHPPLLFQNQCFHTTKGPFTWSHLTGLALFHETWHIFRKQLIIAIRLYRRFFFTHLHGPSHIGGIFEARSQISRAGRGKWDISLGSHYIFVHIHALLFHLRHVTCCAYRLISGNAVLCHHFSRHFVYKQTRLIQLWFSTVSTLIQIGTLNTSICEKKCHNHISKRNKNIELSSFIFLWSKREKRKNPFSCCNGIPTVETE